MSDISKICIDGLERYIVSYECLLFKEPGNLELNAGPLTPHQYLSCLFKNLGYNRCPVDFLWMEKEKDILQTPKTEILDFPITRHCLMLHDKCSLFNLLLCIRNWIKGGIEKGLLPDPTKSFKPHTKEEIEYALTNKIKLTKKVEMKRNVDTWDRSDIFWRRLYNLSPNIDPEYLECSLTNFESFSKQIEVMDPYSIFVSVLVNPDVLMSVIKQSEIEATNIVYNRNSHKIASKILLNELEVAKEFKEILDRKFMMMSTILRNGGPKAFLTNEYKLVKVLPNQVPSQGSDILLIPPISMNDPNTLADRILLGEIFIQIANTPLDDQMKTVIFKYVEPRSLTFLDKLGYDNIYRVATYKRLYYTITQLKNRHPELLNSKDRFILSQSFYIDPDRFGLYSRLANKFYVTGLDLILREMTPQEAVEYYSVYLGKEILLDPYEFPEVVSEGVPYVNLDLLLAQTMGQNNITYPTNIEIVPSNPNIFYANIIPNQQPELYGFDVRNIVQV